MIRQKQKLWIQQMSNEHRSFRQMMKVASTDPSKEGYGYKISKFMRFCVNEKIVSDPESYEKLLELDVEQITDLLIDYIDWQRDKGDSYRTVSSALVAPEAFFDMNRKAYHKKVVRRSNTKEDLPEDCYVPATDEDVLAMVGYVKSSRNKAIILFLGSTGVRPGAMVDPVLKMKNLVPLPDIAEIYNSEFDSPKFQLDKNKIFKRYCYGIKVYDQSKEGYWSFLTPEASNMLDRYLEQRRREGENLSDESPIFATIGNGKKRHNTKYEFFTDDNLDSLLKSAVEGAKIERKLINGRNYDKALTYMFRKRFNGHLKMTNQVNSNIAEKLMAHKRGLDNTYLHPTMEQCYVEFFKAIAKLTVDPNERLEAENKAKSKKILELEIKDQENRKLQDDLKILKLKVERIELLKK